MRHRQFREETSKKQRSRSLAALHNLWRGASACKTFFAVQQNLAGGGMRLFHLHLWFTPCVHRHAMPPPTRFLGPLGLILCCQPAHGALTRIRPDAAAWSSVPLANEADADPSQLCRAAIAATEHNTRIPDAFFSAIGRIESGRSSGGALNPWPWTVNAAGVGHFYPTKAAAMEAVRQFRASGIRSVDVGCLQVNLFYHPDAFASLDQAFDPAANAAYAAKLLMDLFAATGSWPRAAAAYHSMTPAVGLAYEKKVLEEWALPDKPSLKPPREVMRTPQLDMRSREPAVILPAGTQQSAAPPPRTVTTASGAAAPIFGFNRRFLLPAAQAGIGRSLAAYRAMPVQMAWRQPALSPVISR